MYLTTKLQIKLLFPNFQIFLKQMLKHLSIKNPARSKNLVGGYLLLLYRYAPIMIIDYKKKSIDSHVGTIFTN